MKQNKLNKILISVLVVLTLVLGYRALTEQKRVEYYICYNNYSISLSVREEDLKDFCKDKVNN